MKKLGINPEEMPQNIKKILQENTNLKSKIVSQDELDNLMKENRQMKKEIHNLQVKL
jgi:cell division protein FtsB